MQSQERIALISRSKDPETSQITGDDDINTSNEDPEASTLASPDLIERGVRREGMRGKDDRNMWATQRPLCQVDIPARLQPGSGGEEIGYREQSCACESASHVKTQTGYISVATSHGEKWTEKSEDTCIASDEKCAERKEEDPETWKQWPKLGTTVVDNDNDGVSSAINKNLGELCPSKHAPTGARPVSGKSTNNRFSRGTLAAYQYSSFHNRTEPKPNTPSLSSPPLLRLHTPFFSDPNPDPNDLDLTTPSSPILSTAIFDALLDACIEKTRILLAAGREALKSTAGAGDEGEEVCVFDDDDGREGRDAKGIGKEKQLLSCNGAVDIITSTTTIPGRKVEIEEDKERGERNEAERKGKGHCSIAERERAVARQAKKEEIIRVENWYIIKGADACWKEIGGREDMMGLIVELGRDVDVDVC